MVRLQKKVFICPKCRKTLETDSWSPPFCEEDNCMMRADRTGRNGVFVKL